MYHRNCNATWYQWPYHATLIVFLSTCHRHSCWHFEHSRTKKCHVIYKTIQPQFVYIEIIQEIWTDLTFVENRANTGTEWKTRIRWFQTEIQRENQNPNRRKIPSGDHRCTVKEVPYLKSEGGQVLMLQNYPHPLSLRAEALISSPLSLTHDHYLPFYLFPLNPLHKNFNIMRYVKYFLLF